MKASIANLEQRTALLMQKNEELPEKNTQLAEKNSTYMMEIESSREEIETLTREVARLRAECDSISRARAQISDKLEQAHSDLNFVASLYPNFQQMSSQKTLKRAHTPDLIPLVGEEMSASNRDAGASSQEAIDTAGASDGGGDGIQTVQLLHEKLIVLADVLQSERYALFPLLKYRPFVNLHMTDIKNRKSLGTRSTRSVLCITFILYLHLIIGN